MRLTTLILAASISLAGCVTTGVPGLGASDYGREQARAVQRVLPGIVESVRQVKIEGTRSGAGAATGAALGALAGASAGGGRGAYAGGILGALLGGIGGQMAEQAVTGQDGLEIAVRLDDGRVVAITQAQDVRFKAGDRVYVVGDNNGAVRVVPR